MRVDRISRLFTGVHHRGRDVLCHYIHEAGCRPEKLGEDQLQQRLRIQIKLRYIRGQQKKGTREETECALLLPRPPRGPIKIMLAGTYLSKAHASVRTRIATASTIGPLSILQLWYCGAYQRETISMTVGNVTSKYSIKHKIILPLTRSGDSPAPC